MKITKDCYLNINFPNIGTSKVKGIKFVRPGKRKPGTIILSHKTKNKGYYKIPSARKMHKSALKNIDEYELHKGFITISFYKLEKPYFMNKTISNKSILE